MPTEPKSSWIKNIIFNDNTLSVETVNGETYNYHGVDEDVYAELVLSKSKGKFHNQNLRGKYPCMQG